MAHRRNRWLLFCLSISLLPTACNRAQRSPMREPSLEATLEGAPPAAASETVAKGDEAAEGPDCSALGRRVTHCLGPAGGSVRIGPLGAVVATSDGLLTLEVPAAALRSPVTVRIAPTTAPPWTEGFVSHVYDFSPDVDFAIPARLTLAYRNADVPEGVPEVKLSLYTVENGAWTRARESAIDRRKHEVSAPLDRLRTAGALAPMTSLSILSPAGTLKVGDSQVFQAVTVPEGRAVSWAVAPRTIAVIDSRTGRLTALAPGRARVVASGASLLRAAELEVVLPTGPGVDGTR